MIDVGTSSGVESVAPAGSYLLGSEFLPSRSGEQDRLVQVSCRWNTRLDEIALRAAVRSLSAHHPVLRTGIAYENLARPLRVVWRARQPELTISDARHGVASCQLDAVIAADRRPFGHAEPRCRLSVVTEHDRTTMLVTACESLLDGTGARIILGDLLCAHDAAVSGVTPVLHAPLGGRRHTLLPAASSRHPDRDDLTSLGQAGRIVDSEQRSAARAVHGVQLGETAAATLAACARRLDVTEEDVLVSAWAIVVSRLSRSADAAFGVVFRSRGAEHDGDLATVMHVRVPEDSSADEWIARCAEQLVRVRQAGPRALEDMMPDALPLRLETCVEINRPDRGHTGYEDAVDRQPADFVTASQSATPIAVSASRTPGRFEVHYDTASVGQDSIRAIADGLAHVIAALSARPVLRLGGVALSSRRRSAARRSPDVPPAACVHESFEAVADRQPGATAIVSRDGTLSYSDLDAWANRIACRLEALGVSPEDRVLVYESRSRAFIAAALGVMKAGAAYVPIDPKTPESRLQRILELAEAQVALARRGTSVLARAGVGVVSLDPTEFAGEHSARPVNRARPANPAYIIFTSGSTGLPKGVVVPHAGVINLARAQAKGFRIARGTRVLQYASPSFDASVSEIFVTLLAGGVLVIPEEDELSGPALTRLLRRESIEVATIPPSVLAVTDSPDRGVLTTIVSAGEACPAEVIARWAPGRRFINAYGPTETTVCASMGSCRPTEEAPGIGIAMDGVAIHILDPLRHPLPTGATGELWIGGAGIARGYLDRPDLTADRFRPNPFGAPGDRMYRSGDLARFRDDHTIAYHGRIDRQLKVRGYRIEPDEVELVMASHPHVHAAAVVASHDGGRVSHLIGYFVPAADEAVAADDVRAFLVERLPAYMVPTVLVPLDRFPLNLSGKIDRSALPAPRTETSAPEPSPSDSIEAEIGAMWQAVLRGYVPGVHDNFFEVGGHSLLATSVLARIEERFGVEMPLGTFFDEPTITATSAYIRGASGSTSDQGIARVPRGGVLPLSSMQRRFWTAYQLEPDSAAYNVYSAIRMTGALSMRALHESLRATVSRHEILRTVYVNGSEEPAQRILPDCAIDIPIADLSALSPRSTRSCERRVLRRIAALPFDLANGPVVRPLILRVQADEYIVFVAMHHIAADEHTAQILLRDCAEYYNAAIEGRAARLPNPALQYADYAAWEPRHEAAIEAALDYWRATLPPDRAVLNLPARAGAHRGESAGVVSTRIDIDLQRRIAQAAAEAGVTVPALMLAALLVVMHRYSGDCDLLAGVPVATRDRRELRDVAGCFINTVPVRVLLTPRESFKAVLRRVGTAITGALAHAVAPLERIVERVSDRMDRRFDVFQLLFDCQMEAADQPCFTGLRLDHVAIDTETAKTEWSVALSSGADGTDIELKYGRGFDDSDLRQFLGSFQTALRQLVDDIECPCCAVAVLTESQRTELTRFSAAADVPYPGAALHQLIEARAAQAPDDPAVACGEHTLTFAQVDRQATRLAALLTAAGAGAGSVIPVMLKRSTDLVIAPLAVMKTGAAFCPVDPEWPPSRIDAIVRQLHPVAVLASPGIDAGALDVPIIRTNANGGSEKRSSPPVSLEDAVYVIYTSGSTGVPKGAAIPHRGLLNRLHWMNDAFGAAAARSVLQTTHFVFDSAVWQLFWPLMNGGMTIIPAVDVLTQYQDLPDLIERHGVTTTDLVPSILTVLAARLASDDGAARQLGTLRVLIVGGEEMTATAALAFRRRIPHVRLFNLYGPTEASIGCIAHEVTGAEGERVPIGRPIANVRVYLLNADGYEVPPGASGEICLGGACVGLGYVGDEARTEQVFQPDPFRPGALMYRTGDLGRWLSTGELEYLGRIDRQVKLRGYRIEPGEIEAVLCQAAGVRSAAVVLTHDSTGNKRLVAYVAGDALVNASLIAHARARLPEYLMPAIVVLDHLPLTAGGKVDRGALPPFELLDPATEGSTAPRTDLERELASIWADMLGIAQVGVHDNFFDVGGDSIVSIRIAARARQAGIALSPRDLFAHQTVAELAEAAAAAATLRAEPEVQASSSLPTPIQGWFFEQHFPEPHYFNQCVRIVSPAGFDAGALETAVRSIVQQHDALRSRFERTPAGWRQIWTRETPDVFDRGVIVPELIDEEIVRRHRLLNYETGPVFQCAVLELGTHQELVLMAHHLVIDAVSWRILIEDLAAAYRAACRGETVVAQSSTKYATWAARLERSPAEAASELAYWQRELSGEPDVRQQSPKPAHYETLEITMDRHATAAAQHASRVLHAGMQELLITSVATAVGRATNRRSVLMSVEGHGRDDLAGNLDLSRTIGWFTAIYPLRIDIVSGEPRKTLERAKNKLREVRTKALTFGILRYGSDGACAETLSRYPAPAVAFNYFGETPSEVDSVDAWRIVANDVPSRSPRNTPAYQIGVNCALVEGQLIVSWTWAPSCFSVSEIRQMAGRVRETLASLAAAGPANESASSADFPLAHLTPEDFDEVLAQLRRN